MAEAAFGYYPQLKPKRSQQDPEAAKNVPLDVLRGRIAGTLGLFGDVVNQPISMVRPLQMISQALTKKEKYPDTEYMLENLPFKNEAPVSQIAGKAGSFVPMNPAPLARVAKAVPKAIGEVLNDRALKGQGLIPGLPGQPPVAMFAAPPEPKMSSPHGKGWWYNTENKRLLPIDSGDLGPHGDHDGWIGVGNNAEKLGVDPAVALRFQEGSYGFMASKEDVQKAIQRGELDPKDPSIAKDGEYYYSKSYGDSIPTFDEVFERKHGSSMEEAAFSGLPEELSSLVRIRQWPSGMFTYSMQTQPDNRVVQDIVNTMDQLPGFWKAPKVLALLEDGAYAYTLSPENFSRVKSVKDFSKFNDETLAKSSEVTQTVKAETPPAVEAPPLTDPFWYNPSNKQMATFESSGMHNKVAQDPEFTAKLGSTPEEVMHAESPMIMGRQRGEKLDLMQVTPPSDLSLATLREMIAQRNLAPEHVNFSAGESLFENIPKDELLKAEKLQELEQYKKYKDGGSIKSVRKTMRQKLRGYLT